MGNPTSYLGKTLTWEGKQLKTAVRNVGALTIQYSYEYDENGLRTNKTTTIQNSGPQTTEYYYNGSVLIGMRIDVGYAVKLLKFSYDANGTAVAVDYSEDNGSTYTTYYYVRNAQNDVVKLIDGTGSAVVEYTYDTWGKILSVSGSLATTLGYDQPFRYRGYVYDNETQWYYLQSRYYDPTTCRFISADIYLSTGQGVIGHNAFAYCLNNPVNMADEGGNICRPPRTWNETWTDDEFAGGERMPDRFYKQWVHFFQEGEEMAAYDAYMRGDLVYYRGAQLVSVVWPLKTTCAVFGTIHVDKTNFNPTTLRHEYGHLVQEKQLGELKYLIFIGLMSAIHRDVEDYYSLPWELIADYFGGVTRTYSDGAEQGAWMYYSFAYDLFRSP